MPSRRRYQVKEVGRLSGVSVRTLHHYDEIGLLQPSERTRAGYRLYDDDDLLRLQQILIGRELGLSLEQIRRSLDDPSFGRRKALEEQRAELMRRIDRSSAMVRAIDEALAGLDQREGEGEHTMDIEKIFGGFDPSVHEEEVKARWGHTDAYAESARRTKRYSEADWRRFRDEQASLYDEAVALMRSGTDPKGDAAADLAERFRFLIDRWFYPCSHGMHRGLADLYEADHRFAESIEQHAEGLTPFLVEAIRANASRRGAGSRA